MTYVVGDACVKCKYTDCVEVCPVDCFYEDELMLVIDPEVCIDCGVCEPECPVKAITPETKDSIEFVEYAKSMVPKLPNIRKRKEAYKDAEMHKDEKNKFHRYIKSEIKSET